MLQCLALMVESKSVWWKLKRPSGFLISVLPESSGLAEEVHCNERHLSLKVVLSVHLPADGGLVEEKQSSWGPLLQSPLKPQAACPGLYLPCSATSAPCSEGGRILPPPCCYSERKGQSHVSVETPTGQSLGSCWSHFQASVPLFLPCDQSLHTLTALQILISGRHPYSIRKRANVRPKENYY